MEQPYSPNELSLQDLRVLYDRAQTMGKSEPHEFRCDYTSCYLLMQDKPVFRVTVVYRNRDVRVYDYTFQQINESLK